MSSIKPSHRIHGLDVLRSTAIVLVFLYHYTCFVSKQPTFGFLSDIGWVGVDLFFVLSGYLIGDQIFTRIAEQRKFSFKLFYYRRLLRTLPNYLFILAIYFLIPSFRESQILPPLWKFLTFTQNFGLHVGTAFSHAWSLCVEEQFYLILPLFALLIIHKKSSRIGWHIIFMLLMVGIILRGATWIYYSHYLGKNIDYFYYPKIYYFTFCRLDELLLGVAIALLKSFHKNLWEKTIEKGNLILLFSILITTITLSLFSKYHNGFLMTTFGYPLLAVSFSVLTLAAVSPNSYLYNLKIPGATTLALWSYAIYLIHKPISVIVFIQFAKLGVGASHPVAIFSIVAACLMSGGFLYYVVETPFLKLRNTFGQKNGKGYQVTLSNANEPNY